MTVKLYLNQTSFSFNDAESVEPTQVLELTEEDYHPEKVREGRGTGTGGEQTVGRDGCAACQVALVRASTLSTRHVTFMLKMVKREGGSVRSMGGRVGDR